MSDFRPVYRRNPFDNALLRGLLHGLVTIVVVLSVYLAVNGRSWLPIIVGAAIITIAEGVWLYFLLRK